MGTVVNFRRLERLEAKMGCGKNWIQQLSNPEFYAMMLVIGTGEYEGAEHFSQEERDECRKAAHDYACSYSLYGGCLEEMLDELRKLDAPKSIASFARAIKVERQAKPWFPEDWRKGIPEKILACIEGLENA